MHPKALMRVRAMVHEKQCPQMALFLLGGVLRAAGSLVGHVMGFGLGVGAGLVVGSMVLGRRRTYEVETYPEVEDLNKGEGAEPLDDATRERLLGLIPEWVKSPDVDHVTWLNYVVARAWPFAAQASQTLFQESIWPGVKEKLPKFLAIQFKTVSLGDLPPCFDGIKAIDTVDDEMIIETSVKMATNCNIVADVTLWGSMRMTVQVTQLLVQARVRVSMRPLTNKFPCFAAVEVSMLDKPVVDSALKVLGGHDIMALSLTKHMVNHILNKVLSNVLLWPRRLHVPIQHDLQASNSSKGTLLVQLIQAKGLVCRTILGRADPYIKLWVDEQKPVRTKVKKSTVNPVWNEAIVLPVDNPETDSLTLYVMDYQYTVQDSVLGFNKFPLAECEPGKKLILEVELTPPEGVVAKNRMDFGSVDMEVTYRPFQDPVSNADDDVEENGMLGEGPAGTSSSANNGFGEEGSGLLTVTIHNASDLEAASGSHSNAYCKIYLLNDVKRTRVVKHSLDPVWDEEIEFLLPSPPVDTIMKVEVWHKSLDQFRITSGKTPLGTLEIDLGDAVTNGRIVDVYQLLDVQTGTLKMEIQWQQ